MKRISLSLAGALLLGGAAQAQTAPPSGFKVLLALAKVHGVALDLATLQKLPPSSVSAAKLRVALQLSPQPFEALLKAGNQAAAPNLVTRAVLESASGKTLTDSFVAGLIGADRSWLVNTEKKLNEFVRDPGLQNKLAEIANTPVTPRGDGN